MKRHDLFRKYRRVNRGSVICRFLVDTIRFLLLVFCIFHSHMWYILSTEDVSISPYVRHFLLMSVPSECGIVSYGPSPSPALNETSSQSPTSRSHSSVGLAISQPPKNVGQIRLTKAKTKKVSKHRYHNLLLHLRCQYPTKSL